MIDVQEMLEKTQAAKDKFGKEVDGFDDQDYGAQQAHRLKMAQSGLTEIRSLKFGVANFSGQPYEDNESAKYKLRELSHFQEEVQTNVRMMAMSMGLNIGGYLKFLKNRSRLINNSLKRQAGLIQQMVVEQEQM